MIKYELSVHDLQAGPIASNMRGNDMKQGYDFSEGVRGQYLKRYLAGSDVVIIGPEIAAVFKDSELVNEALRTLMCAAGHSNTPLRTRKARRRA